MREDIQRKEREIQDLKNQINLVNLRIVKESEAKEAAEQNQRKNTDNFSQDAHKFNLSVQGAEKDNHTMKLKLQEMVQHVNDSSNNKTHTNSRLEQTNQELDEATRHFTLESDEQNRRIGVLHQELKELQDKINNNNHKGSLMGNKIKDLSETQYRVESEQSESILKLKNEHERLKTENNDIHFKVSKQTKEVEQTKVALDKSTQEKMQAGNQMDQTLANINERLKESTHLNKQLDGELKNASRNF